MRCLSTAYSSKIKSFVVIAVSFAFIDTLTQVVDFTFFKVCGQELVVMHSTIAALSFLMPWSICFGVWCHVSYSIAIS